MMPYFIARDLLVRVSSRLVTGEIRLAIAVHQIRERDGFGRTGSANNGGEAERNGWVAVAKGSYPLRRMRGHRLARFFAAVSGLAAAESVTAGASAASS